MIYYDTSATSSIVTLCGFVPIEIWCIKFPTIKKPTIEHCVATGTVAYQCNPIYAGNGVQWILSMLADLTDDQI